MTTSHIIKKIIAIEYHDFIVFSVAVFNIIEYISISVLKSRRGNNSNKNIVDRNKLRNYYINIW